MGMITLDKSLDKLEKWLTPRRLILALDLAKVCAKDIYEERYPGPHLVFQIGRDIRTIRRWQKGTVKPDRLSLSRLNEVLTHYLGPQWTELVDDLLRIQSGGDNDEPS